jgi:hypothetical protein
MDAYTKILNLYRMMFPLAEFNGDYLSACLNMRREIKNLCKPKFKLPLLMMISVLQMTPKPMLSTPLSELCRTVRLHLEDYCLDLENQEGAQTLIHMKTGTIIRESPSTICDKFYDYVSDLGEEKDDYLVVSLYGTNSILRPYPFANGAKEDSIREIINNVGEEDISSEDQNKFINLLSELVISNRIFSRIERNYSIVLTLQDKEFLRYIHSLFINRKIPFDMQVKDVCNNYEVLKFKSSVGL